jgi:hypothetical protein
MGLSLGFWSLVYGLTDGFPEATVGGREAGQGYEQGTREVVILSNCDWLISAVYGTYSNLVAEG